MQLNTIKLDQGVFKVTAFTTQGHYMFEKTISALDVVEAETKFKDFCEKWLKEMGKWA